jgi:hypothetical protein
MIARILLLTVAVGALHCGSTGNDVQVATRAPSEPESDGEPQPGETKRLRVLATGDELEDMHAAAFLPLVPKSFEGFRAKSDPEGRDIDLGEGARFTVLKRGYAKGGVWLEIEIVDTEGSKALRALFEKTRELDRDTKDAVIKPIKVQGNEAVAQWNSTSKDARVTVLAENRYLVNVRVRPADGIAAAVALAEKVELDELAKTPAGSEIAKH